MKTNVYDGFRGNVHYIAFDVGVSITSKSVMAVGNLQVQPLLGKTQVAVDSPTALARSGRVFGPASRASATPWTARVYATCRSIMMSFSCK